MLEAGLPDGVVNVVTGFGETAGAALAAHPGVDKIAFTGSTEVGKLIVKAATGNLKKVSLELGGKSPNVVYDDADMETAIPGAANAIFFNHGQCCSAGSRLFVEKGSYDEVVAGVAEHAKQIKVGPGLDPDTDMGPLVSDEQLQRVTGFLESGEAEGAETVTGGKRIGDSRWYDISREVEKTMREDKPDLYPNVDFYSASVYHMMGIPIDQFTPVFAISRMAGWTAQLLEQYANNRLIRPESDRLQTSGRLLGVLMIRMRATMAQPIRK